MSLALVPEETVREITTQAEQMEQIAQAVVITDEASLKKATDIVSWVAKAKKAFEEKRKFFVQPLNDQVKRINEMFKEYTQPLERADTLLRGKILAYRQEQERKRREEEERLRKLAEKEQKRLEKQAAKNGMPAPPPVVVPSQPPAAKTIQSDMGAAQVRMVWDFEIVDETQIPREFLMPNVPAIRAAVKAGVRNIPGVKIFQREELAVRAR
ncbi:MAG: siphovirus Gp157 family protein [Peptococcaceae bacterium]|nr:siphovirus Gp157 family protein [Peptococcaceae bacterium]